MIKFNRASVAAPDYLVEVDGPGSRETARNIAAFAANEKLVFTAYSHDSVKEQLILLFGRKCCFCESMLMGVVPGDVEHYRPKNRVVVKDAATGAETEKNGYYWLGASWDNLLYACPDCNRGRYLEKEDGEVEKLGKACFFPLEDEGARVSAPGPLDGEAPLLLNPCIDEPAEHLTFTDLGSIEAVEVDGVYSARGKATIECCGLFRQELFAMRAVHRRTVLMAVKLVKQGLPDRTVEPNEIDELRALLHPKERFTAYTRFLLRTHLLPFTVGVELQPELAEILNTMLDDAAA